MSSISVNNAFLVLGNVIIESKLMIGDDKIEIAPKGNVVTYMTVSKSSMSLREYSVIAKLSMRRFLIRISDVKSMRYYRIGRQEHGNLIERLRVESNEMYDVYIEGRNGSYRLLLDRVGLRKLKSLLHGDK